MLILIKVNGEKLLRVKEVEYSRSEWLCDLIRKNIKEEEWLCDLYFEMITCSLSLTLSLSFF